ncbi:LysR family transcriptional regulator [Aeromonas sp. 102P]|uniref:LysR family transcriptional regulator n=1 Tax=Aeromonas sp. 102P TaxID=3452711 RepID=UPI003F7A54E9
MKSFNINNLRVIKRIAQEQNISAAATKMGSSQANFSRILSHFEEQLGLKIFHRSTRSLTKTDFGKVLLHRIDNLLQSHDDIVDFIESYKRNPYGNIKLAAPAIAISFFTRHIMPSIAIEHPDISISFITVNSASLLFNDSCGLMPSDWDIYFSLHQPKDETLVARPVSMFSMGMFASPKYLASHPIEHPQDLISHKCILLEILGRQENIWRYRDPLTNDILSILVTGSYTCDQIQPAIELARNGLGVLHAPLYSVMDELDAGALIPCFSGRYHVEHPHYLIYRKRNYQPHRINVVIDSIINFFDKKTSY